jgi:hypothetical protein
MTRLDDEAAVRTWITDYREEHAGDDPAAAHVQVIRLRLFGGTLIPREQFFA